MVKKAIRHCAELKNESVIGLGEIKGIEVATVDGFQGREKEVIVISMVRSNP